MQNDYRSITSLMPIRIAHLLGCLVLPAAAMAAEINPWIFADRFEDRPPNILLVILDDIGIDQFSSFGYGGAAPPSVPSIDTIAEQGLRFRNTWATPVCSPSRAMTVTGRYPMRNRLMQVIGPHDLANSQLSEFELTVPRLLKHAGYQSAMFGKFHLAGPFNHAAGNGTPLALGWDHFTGWILGAPSSIDTTAGGVAPEGTYSCGFVPDTTSDPDHGADAGACYVPNAEGNITCVELGSNNADGESPGLQCLIDGGILMPGQSCQMPAPAQLAWDRRNAHYVSNLVINDHDLVEEVGLFDPRGRGYSSTIEADAAIDWINQQQGSRHPWMVTLAFTAPHTPVQNPPAALLPSGLAGQLTSDCNQLINRRHLSDAMIEAVDTELGRVLVETGLAKVAAGGGLDYDPTDSNTVVIVVSDNGTFAPFVKTPFDPTRAKGTAYQGGIWVPLVVAGPKVAAPGRAVEHMVNIADLFRLFGELAGLDVTALAPGKLDAVSMQPYLENPDQFPLRRFNFVQTGQNLQLDGAINGPCQIQGLCSHTLPAKSVCEDNGGRWWGEGADDPAIVPGLIEQGVEHCWQVNQAIYHNDPDSFDQQRIPMMATETEVIRNHQFKLIRGRAMEYDPATDAGVAVLSEELYHINQAVPTPLLDREDLDLLADGPPGPIVAMNYAELSKELEAILASQPPCPGDGNYDGRVDQTDINNYHAIRASGWSGSSTYDFNLDGQTDAADLAIIEQNLGLVCDGN
jgi:arylsulfatase A-like enzyme